MLIPTHKTSEEHLKTCFNYPVAIFERNVPNDSRLSGYGWGPKKSVLTNYIPIIKEIEGKEVSPVEIEKSRN